MTGDEPDATGNEPEGIGGPCDSCASIAPAAVMVAARLHPDDEDAYLCRTCYDELAAESPLLPALDDIVESAAEVEEGPAGGTGGDLADGTLHDVTEPHESTGAPDGTLEEMTGDGAETGEEVEKEQEGEEKVAKAGDGEETAKAGADDAEGGNPESVEEGGERDE